MNDDDNNSNGLDPRFAVNNKNDDKPKSSLGQGINLGTNADRARRSAKPRSGIRGLEHKSHQLPTDHGGMQPVSHVMSDDYLGRRKKMRILLMVGIAVGLVAVIFLRPDIFTNLAAKGVEKWKEMVSEVEGNKKSYKKRRKKVEKIDKRKKYIAAKVKQTGRYIGNAKCSQIIRTRFSATDLKQMSLAEKVRVSECYLIYDDPVSATSILGPWAKQMGSANDRTFDDDIAEGGQGEAFLTLVEAYLRQNNTREADKILTKRCRVWQRSNVCISKLMVLVDRNFTNAAMSAYKQMSRKSKKVGKKALARFWLMGAELSARTGDTKTAGNRYKMALLNSPASAQSLRKRTYEMYAVELYRQNNMLELKKVTTRALNEFKGLKSAGKMKLNMLKALTNPNTGSRTIGNYIASDEVVYLVKNDLGLLDILGKEAIRNGHEESFIRLLKKTTDHFVAQNNRSTNVTRFLKAWELRTMLSKKDYEFSLRAIGSYESAFKKDYFSTHMRGVVYMGMSPNKSYQSLASKEFKTALRMKKTWESMFALGSSLIRSEQIETAGIVINDLNKEVQGPIQRFWAEMLMAEYYIAVKKYADAIKILRKWRVREPTYSMPLELMVAALKAQGRSAEYRKLEMELDVLNSKVNKWRTEEGLSSPVGPLVFGTEI